jgi:hypothetical protein
MIERAEEQARRKLLFFGVAIALLTGAPAEQPELPLFALFAGIS